MIALIACRLESVSRNKSMFQTSVTTGNGTHRVVKFIAGIKNDKEEGYFYYILKNYYSLKWFCARIFRKPRGSHKYLLLHQWK